jgi:Protein of unknown function (DUF3352)
MTTNDPGPEPEYLGDGGHPVAAPDGTPPMGRGRRTGLVAAAAVAVVAAVGAGAYGVVQLMAGGSSPASAVPSDAVGYVSLDLDPSASQKIEAFKILRKFPALKKEIGGSDDVRRTVFEEIVKSGDCKDLDYARDVEPWIGDRVAVAAVPDSKQGALPLVVLQVTDQDKARAGFRTLESCDAPTDQEPSRTGLAFRGDYMLVAETQAEADGIAKDVDAATLADSADFAAATGRTGDPGIVTMYASPDAPDAFLTAMRNDAGGSSDQGRIDQLGTSFAHFQGAAGVLRFSHGAVEAEFSAKGLPQGAGSSAAQGGPDVSTLPGTTAAVLSVALQDGWLDSFTEGLRSSLGSDYDQMLAEGERATGLQLPEDVETLLGDGVSLSVDAGTDLKALSESPDPGTVPVGLRIQGDPAKITPILDKLKAAAGPSGDLVHVASGDGVVAVGPDPDNNAQLLARGSLGGVHAFDDVVPEADRANAVVFVNFDAGSGWAEQLADLVSDGDPEAKQNVAPLDALGFSGWRDGDDVQHTLVRLTTD